MSASSSTIKLVIIGPSGVGKTSLRGQYISGRFSTGYRATIGADFITKTLPHPSRPDESVVLQIWDTAGQERFSSLSSAFFRGADAAVLCFDANDRQSLRSLTKWWDEFRQRTPVADEELEEYCCVVVGNKTDLAREGAEEAVGAAEAEALLEELLDIPDRGGASRSRSRSSSRFYTGTMTTTATGMSIYHTPSSSVFDVFHSARASPEPSVSPSGSYARSRRSTLASTVTITPSLFAREHDLDAVVHDSDVDGTTRLQDGTTQPQDTTPELGPRLFFASAKTGENVPDIFEYVARRVVRRWEREERRMGFGEHDNPSVVHLNQGEERGRGRGRMGACC
ncbi:ras-domain-containing protein [Schizophyllum commune Loenen D]|nr:ras-domain-containing protein [Schizophyllum commune Loenen D]